MNTETSRIIVVTGATGRQGGHVTRVLLKDGWRVRALTRNPNSPKAQALSALGAEVVQGDMNDRQSLQPVFQGAYGVYSVQNPMISGLEAEVQQGKIVADVAKQANVQHLVYGSAGIGKPTGIGSWDSKLQVEAHMKELGIPLTILRPMAFLELMTDKDFYPAVSTWYLMPKLMGATRPLVWIGTHDLGVIAAKAFASPDQFIGQDIQLASDVKSLEECRAAYGAVMGKQPSRFPMPIWLFKRFVGTDLITMWQWLRTSEIDLNTEPTHTIHPEALGMEAWLRQYKSLREGVN
ncbi:MAG: NmrA/HSCARG family protein [Anaerolineae bacterium]|nr:NmrA/HSCARG family protein [Anaerolineae bacterium]